MTKDGINAQSSAAFFKSIKEESSVTIEEVVGTLGKTYKWELPVKARASDEVDQLEKSIEEKLGSKWTEARAGLRRSTAYIEKRSLDLALFSSSQAGYTRCCSPEACVNMLCI